MQHTVMNDYSHPELDWVGDSRFIFITAHRRENLGEPMHNMFRAIRRVLDEHPDVKAIYPIHMIELKLVGTQEETSSEWFTKLLDDEEEYEKMVHVASLWGWTCVREDYGCARGERERGVEVE